MNVCLIIFFVLYFLWTYNSYNFKLLLSIIVVLFIVLGYNKKVLNGNLDNPVDIIVEDKMLFILILGYVFYVGVVFYV